MNVLIAEDDALTRLVLQRAVEHDGHACLVAQDGLEAWQLFQAHGVDVVISDWLMPLVDGIELCRCVRKQTDRACGYASRRPHQLTPSSRSLLARLQHEVSTGARTTMRAGGQGHTLLVATRALARIAFPSGMHAGVPCEVLLWR